MDLQTLREKYKTQILSIAESCNVENIRIFGSVARGEASENSDIDILFDPKPGSGFSVGGLHWRLEELLHCKVDVIPDTSVHWYIRDQILKEAVPL